MLIKKYKLFVDQLKQNLNFFFVFIDEAIAVCALLRPLVEKKNIS